MRERREKEKMKSEEPKKKKNVQLTQHTRHPYSK